VKGHNYGLCKKCGKVHVHPLKGKHHSKATKEKISKALKGRKGHKHTEETKRKLRELNLGSKNPNWKPKVELRCPVCGKVFYVRPSAAKQGRKFCSIRCSNIYRRKKRGSGWHHSEATKKKLKAIMNTPEVREKIASKLRGDRNPMKRPEVREKHKKAVKEKQAPKIKKLIETDLNYRRKILEASYKGWLKLTKQLQRYLREGLPNPAEKKLQEILNNILPGEYKYNNGWFVLGTKIPDFVNVNGKKKLIELFGELYHKPEEVHERISYFKKYGWDTLIIWANELNNKKEVEEKILKFNNTLGDDDI